ncbi:MAG: restriction endonuclease subunit S [Oxalobacter sp.]|nr:restriction endonuclease subunit S [Oxalobacter sp.]
MKSNNGSEGYSFEEKLLGEVINCFDHKRIPLSSMERSKRQGVYPYYGAQGIIDYVNDYLFDGDYILIAEDGENLKSRKKEIASLVDGQFWVNNHAHIIQANKQADNKYLYYLLNFLDLTPYITGSAQPKLNQASLKNIQIRLPNISIQEKIAGFLSDLDSKIRINNRINRNLLH